LNGRAERGKTIAAKPKLVLTLWLTGGLAMAIQFRVLGGVEAEYDGCPINIGYTQLRAVLAALLVEPNRLVPVDQLVDRIWGTGQLPRNPRAGIQHSIALLRAAVAPIAGTAITWRAPGYQLTADPATIDLYEFYRLVDTARADADIALLTQALDLWRGEPFTGMDTPWFIAHRSVLVQKHQAAQQDLLQLRLERGEHAVVLGDLVDLVQRHPLDERLVGQYMLALYRSGRSADALAQYHQLRARLADELGTDPGQPLQQLHQRMLTADPTLAPSAVEIATARRPVPHQLPALPGRLVGRATELAHLDGPVDAVTMSAIVGTGGIGKSWLALHWAHQNLDRFLDGELHVDLRGFDPVDPPMSPATAVRGFLDALGVAPAAIPADRDAQVGLYRSLVAGKRMLIVLDNARDTDQVTPLLPGSPSCTVLITSRHQLGGLVATHRAQILNLDVLSEPEARQLLALRLGEDRIAAEPEAVTDLLSYCAGLPLALGILTARAAHHPTFPLAVLAGELRDVSARLDGFNAGELRVNLCAVLACSVRALSSPAATLFGLLGIAPGPDIGLPAVAALAALSQTRARATLRELEHASLVAQPVPGRYRMHDLIRLHATDTSHQHNTDDALRRVLDFYLHTARTADHLLDPHRQPLPIDPPAPDVHPLPLSGVPEAMAWFDTEHPVLLAAQRTAASHAWHATVCQLAWALHDFHQWRGHLHGELAAWRVALNAAARLPDPTARIQAHQYLGRAHAALGRHDQGITHLYQALALAEQHDDADQQAHTHRILAWAWERHDDDRQAIAHAVRAQDLFSSLDQPVWRAAALNLVGWSTARLGQYESARTHCQTALTLFHDHRDPAGEAVALDSLGYIAHHTGDHRQAIGNYQRALTLLHTLGNTYCSANTLDALGHPHLALGEHEQARAVWQKALQLYRQQGRDQDAGRLQRQLGKLG
jgi:DNA-binding SARP family transcriptional activator/tetratricopeptide (TPR) repeat protein